MGAFGRWLGNWDGVSSTHFPPSSSPSPAMFSSSSSSTPTLIHQSPISQSFPFSFLFPPPTSPCTLLSFSVGSNRCGHPVFCNALAGRGGGAAECRKLAQSSYNRSLCQDSCYSFGKVSALILPILFLLFLGGCLCFFFFTFFSFLAAAKRMRKCVFTVLLAVPILDFAVISMKIRLGNSRVPLLLFCAFVWCKQWARMFWLIGFLFS